MDGVKDLHKTDFYSVVTGVDPNEIPFGIGTTRIDPFGEGITLKNIDKYYNAVLLFEKRHGVNQEFIKPT